MSEVYVLYQRYAPKSSKIRVRRMNKWEVGSWSSGMRRQFRDGFKIIDKRPIDPETGEVIDKEPVEETIVE